MIYYDATPDDPAAVSSTSKLDDQVNNGSKLEVKLPNLSSDTFELVLDFIYSGEVPLNDDNVEDVLLAADVFVMEDLKALCWSYLSKCTNDSWMFNFLLYSGSNQKESDA